LRQERRIGRAVAGEREQEQGPQRFFDVFQLCPAAIRARRTRGYRGVEKYCDRDVTGTPDGPN
jgi:hypothetical protein